MERLWTPWRMRYVGGDTPADGCIFCQKPAAANDVADLILYRGTSAFIIMNLFPYNTGHVMVVPYAHAADLSLLGQASLSELFSLLPWVTAAQRKVLHCDGFNVGLNLGSVAGAGVAEHLHVHVVPRWEGDANFMPILANTMVLPELLPVTYAKLRAELELSGLAAAGEAGSDQFVPQAGAVVYLPDKEKIALRRARDGSIVLPKGHIEAGEAAYQAALREVGEEMGLRAEIAGWAGTLEIKPNAKVHDARRVAYLIVTAEPGLDFSQHLDRDTLLLPFDEAVSALSHEPARRVLREAFANAPALFGEMSASIHSNEEME